MPGGTSCSDLESLKMNCKVHPHKHENQMCEHGSFPVRKKVSQWWFCGLCAGSVESGNILGPLSGRHSFRHYLKSPFSVVTKAGVVSVFSKKKSPARYSTRTKLNLLLKLTASPLFSLIFPTKHRLLTPHDLACPRLSFSAASRRHAFIG